MFDIAPVKFKLNGWRVFLNRYESDAYNVLITLEVDTTEVKKIKRDEWVTQICNWVDSGKEALRVLQICYGTSAVNLNELKIKSEWNHLTNLLLLVAQVELKD